MFFHFLTFSNKMAKRKYKRSCSRKKGKRNKTQRKRKVKRRVNISIKPRFKKTLFRISKVSPLKRKSMIGGASNSFINDFSSALNNIRKRPELANRRQVKVLRRNRKKLQLLANKKTPIKRRRAILTQKGGIFGTLLTLLLGKAIAG